MTNSTHVYIAGPYAARDGLLALAHRIEVEVPGVVVTSSWLREVEPVTAGNIGLAPGMTDDERAAAVERDLADIDRSGAFLMVSAPFATEQGWMTPWQDVGGSRHVELGYALAKALDVLHVGPAETMFASTLGPVTMLDTAVGWCRSLARAAS